ncbi:hypothetical protein P8C59_008693 [Phyllachora maydis]|uniref:DNA 3'-5' helicase n=1 Tax=Phyllachora maydis TaxID=1825666 RepID=A0AAD9MEV0_9PEZI|nr:hypothetical protein P8C59_008693 [Phyllachora maydis]
MLASPFSKRRAAQDKPGQPSAPRPSSIILDNLNAAQARAVRSNANTVAILAGPGSGKTHTLASRVVWLVDKAGHRPQDVLVATFTVKAAREMQARIGKALGEGRERKLVLGTFHSIARRYLAVYGSRIGLNTKFGIADDSDSRGVINRICKRLQLSCDPQRARAWISKKKAKGTAEEVQTSEPQASDKKSALRDLEACFNEYQRHLERSNLLDYDDLLVKCVALLRSHPECVSNLQAVLIDEYQDTNGVQYELMRLFAQRHRRITVVGDPDQSIYGWRSAEIKNLYRMLRDYPGTQEVALEENYRSSELILRTSLSVIQQDQTRYKKMLKPVHNRGTSPVLRKLRDAHAEADWIVSEIKRATLMSGGMMTHDDVAVLLRSAALSRHVESALGKAGIAYRMVGGFKFYDRSEIKIILDYLRVIHQPENNDALARILNVPRRGVGDGTVKNLVEEAEMSSMSLWTLLTKHFRGDRIAKSRMTRQAEQRMSRDLFRLLTGIRRKIDQIGTGTPFGLVEMIQELIVALRFQTFLEATHPDDHEQRWANVQEFFNLAADFVRDLEKAGDDSLPEIEGIQQTKEADALPRFLANVALASDAQTGETDEARTPLVTLSTIHAAKGLEWPVVFVPAVYNGSIPHARSEDGNEERRLLYVAMTRAQALLYLSYPTCSHGGDRNEPSPFVASLKNCFAKIGPCFDYSVMKQVSLILGRELPPEKDIFTSLPRTGFCLEDNKHPEDPEEETRWETGDDKWGHGSDASTAPRNKLLALTRPPWPPPPP